MTRIILYAGAYFAGALLLGSLIGKRLNRMHRYYPRTEGDDLAAWAEVQRIRDQGIIKRW